MLETLVIFFTNEAKAFYSHLPEGHAKRMKIRRLVVAVLWIEFELSRTTTARLVNVDVRTIDNDKNALREDEFVDYAQCMARA